MKTHKIFIATLLLFSLTAISQITKGNWMVGGNAKFTYSEYSNTNGTDSHQGNVLGISPNLGFFLKDKFVIGLVITISHNHQNGVSSSGFAYGGGTFVRYYFLKPEKPINIFIEANYGYYTGSDSKSFNNIYGFKGGTVFFFNSSVGLEFLINYNKLFSKYVNDSYNFKEVSVGLGLQIHLEK